MQTGIQDPNIAAGFAALANILNPSAQGMIEADLSRVKRDGMVLDQGQTRAETRRIGADQGRIEAVTRGTDADTAVTSRETAAIAELSRIFSDPNFDASTPAGRAAVAGAMVGTKDGLTAGPEAMTGYSSYIDPNFAGSADDFSNILLGTGVVANQAATPSGFGTDQTRQRDQAAATVGSNVQMNDADNAALAQKADQDRARAAANDALVDERLRTTSDADRAARAAIAGNTNQTQVQMNNADNAALAARPATNASVPTVTPAVAVELDTMLGAELDALFPDTPPDPALARRLQTRVAQLYQTTKNAPAAVAQAIEEAKLAPITSGSEWNDGASEQTVLKDRGLVDTLAGPAPAASQTMVNPSTGEVIVLDTATNTWVPAPKQGR